MPNPPPGNDRLSGDYPGMMGNDLLDSHEWCSIHIPKVVYMDTFCLLYQMLGAGGDTQPPGRFCSPSGDVFLHRWTFDCYRHRGSECSHHSIGHRHQVGLRLWGFWDRWRRKGNVSNEKVAVNIENCRGGEHMILKRCEQSVRCIQIQIWCMFLGDCGTI